MSVFEDTWRLEMDKSFERDVAKLDRRVDKLDKSFEGVEKEAKQTNRALAKTAKTTKKAGKGAENATKAFEGMAQGMGVSAVSGERLANVWLAAGAAVGALIGAVGILTAKALTAYTAKNIDAKNAVERLEKAQQRFLVTLGEAIFAEEKGITTLDSFAGKLDQMGAVVKENDKAVRGFAEGLVDVTSAVTKFYTFGIQLALLPITGFIDLVLKAGGGVLKFSLEVVEAVAGLAKVYSIMPEKMQKVIGFTNGMQDAISGLTDLSGGLTVKLHDSMQASRDFAAGIAGAAKGNKKFESSLVDADRAVQEFTGPVQSWGDETVKQVGRVKDGFFELEKAVAKAGQGFGALETKGFSAAEVGFGGDFEGALKSKGGLGGAAGRLTQGKEGLGGAISATVDPAVALQTEQLEALDGAFETFARGGVMLAVDSLGMFASQLASGSVSAQDMGRTTLLAAGQMLEQLGQSAVAAGLIGDWFQKGGLLSNPAAGIGLGIAAILLGKALSGGLGGSGGGSRSGGGGRAASAARATGRALDSSRSKAEDDTDAPIIIVMDGQKVGRGSRVRNAQALRRGEFVAGASVRGAMR